MSLAFRCERCGKNFTAGSEWAGRRGKCKQCGHEFRIPGGPAGGSSASASVPRPAGEGARSRAARTTPAQAAPAPWSFARDGDPYGIHDEPSPKQAPGQEPDIDELLPQRARPTSKPKKRRGGSKSDQASFPFWVLLVGAIGGLVLARAVWLYRPPGMHPGWIVLAFTGYTLSFSGVLACVSVAFREGLVHGFCCLFAPFYILYYVASRWVDTKEGFALAGLGSILLAVVNSLQPALIENFKHRSRLGVAGHPRQFQHFAQPGMPRHPFPGPGGGPHVQNVPPPGVVPPGGPTRRNEPAPATPAPPEVVPLDFTEQVLADLKSPDLHTRKHGLNRLNGAPANDRRAEVAKAVEPLLKDPDGFCRSNAARVLGGSWGGPENVPALLEGLKDPEFGVRWSVLDALTARHDPASAEGIVDYMLNFDDRFKAVGALKAIGPPAEDAVLRGLSHHDGFTRMDVCKILKEIGTRKSIVPLQRFLRRGSDHGLDVMAANEALRQIAYRTRNER